jgi:hypothetical protein
MSQCPRRAWCGAMGCIIRRTARPSPSAARRLVNRRWSPHQPWTGRPCVRSVGRPILSGVLPAGSGSCARASSHGEEHLPACPQRRAPHEIRTTGETCQGRRVPGGGQGTGSTACRQSSGVADASGTAIAPACEGPARPVPARMTEGSPTVTSIARGGQNLVRPHRNAVSPTKCYRKCSGPGVRPPRGSLP